VGSCRSEIKNVGIGMKGIFYSIMISLMLIPILALIIFYSQSSQMRDIDIDIRANELEYFTKSIEKDLLRFIEINGKRTLISAVSKVVVNGTGLDDAQLRLTEMIENGTLYGEPAPLVDTANLETWRGKIEDMADKVGFNVEFKNIQINTIQNNSFNISFDVNITINISDKTEVMGIVKNIKASALVSIEGIEDPIFPLKTYGRVVRFIRASNVSKNTIPLVTGQDASGIGVSGDAFVKIDFQDSDVNSSKILVTTTIGGKNITASGFAAVVSEDSTIPQGFSKPIISGASGATSIIKNGTKIYVDTSTKKVWDLSNLTSDIKNDYYHNSSSGASFLDRLEGNITISQKYEPYGLETFVYLPDLTAANVPIDSSLSVLDHKYWNNIAGSQIRNGGYDLIFNWFKINTLPENDYGINDLIQ
jgi:phosphohistidine swiveling domain-containing protein